MLDISQIREGVSIVASEYPIKKVDLFGSYAEGRTWMAYDLALNEEVIYSVKKEVVCLVHDLMRTDLVEVILYGSCSRGDYTEDSDIDIALITKCNRLEAKEYSSVLAGIATELAMKYFAKILSVFHMMNI